MQRVIVWRWLGRVLRFALGGLFVWTSIAKIITPADFLSSVLNYELISPSAAAAVATVLPWVQFVVGVCLLGGMAVPGALIVCMGMFALFAFAHASVLYRGMSIDCGCGLIPGDDRITYFTLARSLFLLFTAWTAYACTLAAQKNSIQQIPATAHENAVPLNA
jgi:hypothetical protein